jgi:hypothetical protein
MFIYSINQANLIGFCYYFSMQLIEKNKGAEAPLGILGYKVYLPRHSWFFRPQVRNANRWRLKFLLDLGSSPALLPSQLSHPVETDRPHHKHTVWNLL